MNLIEVIGVALGAFVAFGYWLSKVKKDAVKDARQEDKDNDYEYAKDIRDRVSRDKSERVREYDGRGYRD